jgi:Big-like domain-containing protein
MPRFVKTVLAVAVSGVLVAAQAADAQSTQKLLTRAKQALAPGGPAIEPTPVLRDLAVRLPSLRGAERRQAHALLARPTDGDADPQGSGYTVPEATPYCSAHFCVHYVTSTEDAPNLSDGNANSVPDYVETTATAAEYSRTVENDQLGWRLPKDDGDGKTDIYLKQLGGSGIYGYTAPDPEQQLPEDHSLYGYIVIDNDFQQSEFPQYASPTTPLEVTLAHEYNHVLQFNYDAIQDTWMLESTAVWMEGEVYPAAFDYLQYLRGWVQLTSLPLTTFSTDPNDRDNVKVYGSAVWNKWLAAHYGAGVVRRAWEVSLDTDPASFAVGAYDRAIKDNGGQDFATEFSQFAAATAEWQAQNSGFPEGSHYQEDVVRAGTANVNGAGGTIKLNHATYALVEVHKITANQLKLGATAPAGTSAALALVGREGGVPGGTMTVALKTLPSGGSGSVTIDNPSRFARLTAVVINADSRLSGASAITGDWIYSRDSQPYYLRVTTDFTAPRVTRVSPRSGAKRVSRKTRVRVTFSEAVRGVTTKSLRLIASNGRVVGAKVSAPAGSRVATLTPRKALGRNRVYRVRVTTAVTDTAVNPLALAATSAFRTAK